jgi:hypothetical protein
MSENVPNGGAHGIDSSKGLTEQERRGLEDLIRGIFFQVEAAEIIRREGGDCDAIVNVAFDELRPSTRAAGDTTRTVHQTIVYFTRPKLKTPAFTAGPMRGIVGGAMRKVLGFVGVPTVNLPAYPDFNKQFNVMSFQPGATQRLFTQPVVDAIVRHSDFIVTSGPGGIAVYRRGKTVPPSERQAFYRAAREIADRIIESAAALPAEATTGGQQALQTVQTMGGWLGHRLQAWAVSAQEVNDFLAQAPPRVAPHGIRKCAYGSSGFTMIWGAVFLFWGAIFVSAILIIGVEDEPGGKAPAWPYVLMILPLMGGVVLFFAARYRWCRRRILRDGICEQAKVVWVRDTGFYSGSDRQHYVTFESASGRVVVRLGSGPASLARTLQERGGTARLLVDPQGRSRALWIEGWAMDAYE